MTGGWNYQWALSLIQNSFHPISKIWFHSPCKSWEEEEVRSGLDNRSGRVHRGSKDHLERQHKIGQRKNEASQHLPFNLRHQIDSAYWILKASQVLHMLQYWPKECNHLKFDFSSQIPRNMKWSQQTSNLMIFSRLYSLRKVFHPLKSRKVHHSHWLSKHSYWRQKH